jgi:hypothetical protein
MLLLASTSDLLRVVTTSTASTDVHASWVDLNGSTVTPGRTNTPISTATTTTVVASPGASTYRTVKTLTVRNRHASTSQTVTVVHTDGTNAMEVIKCTLAAGESLMYVEGAGFWQTDLNGLSKVANYGNVGQATGSGLTTVVLASDVTNNNASANTIADVTGLSFSVTSGKMYYFDFHVVYTAAATTTGSRWAINGPTTTYLNYRSEYSLTTTTSTRNAMLQAYDSPAASNATSAATGNNWAQVTGVIQPSADGTLVARFASEVSSSAIVAKAGSFVLYQQIN